MSRKTTGHALRKLSRCSSEARSTVRKILFTALAINCFITRHSPCVVRASDCSNVWSNRIDIDLEPFQSGIRHESLKDAEKQVPGGYRVLIYNHTVYAIPLAGEAQGSLFEHRKSFPHEWLVMFVRTMCTYDIPNIEFVLNVHDRNKAPTFSQPVPLFAWGKENNNGYEILLPYFQLLWLNKTVSLLSRTTPSWSERLPKAFWRGTTTGGVYTRLNWEHYPRSKLVKYCSYSQDNCNASFSGFPQTHREAREVMNKTFGAWPSPVSEHSRYKYVVVNDGNGAPSSRLALMMMSGSVVLKQESPFIEWFYDDLIPYTHYVPISYLFSDLNEKIEWVRRNDAWSEQMTNRAFRYAKAHFSEYHISCYINRLFQKYKSLLAFEPKLNDEFLQWKLKFKSTWFATPSALAQRFGLEVCKFYNHDL